MGIDVIGASKGPGSPAFSSALRVGDLLFVSGQASVDEAGAIVRDTFEGELRRSLANLERILAAAGLGLDHVVQVRAYVDDAGNLAAYNQLYREYFNEPMPARTTLVNCLGDLISFEIEAVACLSATRVGP